MKMKISSIKKRYKDEWVLVNVFKEDKLNQPVEGEIIVHSKDKDEIFDKMKKLPKGFRVSTFFTGRIPPKDMVFAFTCLN